MASTAEQREEWRNSWFRKAMWAGAALLLLMPALAMGFATQVNWTASDFAFAALLLIGSAGLVELAARANASGWYRTGAMIAVGAGLLTIWANAAVGMVGSEANAYNDWFLAVPVLALAGAVLARFRARGMALAVVGAGVAQGIAGLGGLASDPRGGAFAASFAALWLLSAACFGRAARDGKRHTA